MTERLKKGMLHLALKERSKPALSHSSWASLYRRPRGTLAAGTSRPCVPALRILHLASHSDAQLHRLYVMRTTAMQEVPAACVRAARSASIGPGWARIV